MSNEEPKLDVMRNCKFKKDDLVIHKTSGEQGKVIEVNHYEDKEMNKFKADVFVEIEGKHRTWMRDEDLEFLSKETENVKTTESVEVGNRKM